MSRIKWNSEQVLSISAMTISFLTLMIFIYQTNLMRKQNYISILPYLAVSTSDDKEKHSFTLSLDNYGVGPAIIESAVMLYQGKRYDLSDYDDQVFTFFRSQLPELDSIRHFSSSTLGKGMAVPVNSKYKLLRVGNSPEEYQLMMSGLNTLMKNGLDYEIIYKSIQNERWLIHDNSQGPEKLD